MSLFEDTQVAAFDEQLYGRILKEKKIDIYSYSTKKDIDTVDFNTLKNKYFGELCAEWLSCKQFDNWVFTSN